MSDSEITSTRDVEFIRIMKGQLGQSGMSIITNLGFYFVTYFFIIVTIVVMGLTILSPVQQVAPPTSEVLKSRVNN